MIQAHRLFVSETGMPFKGAQLMRGDDIGLGLLIVDQAHKALPNQPEKVISLRLVVKLASEHPHGAPLLVKQGSDFDTTVTENVLQASFGFLGLETSIFPETTQLIYDLERTINGSTKTIEQGVFTVVPDVAV